MLESFCLYLSLDNKTLHFKSVELEHFHYCITNLKSTIYLLRNLQQLLILMLFPLEGMMMQNDNRQDHKSL